VVGHRHGNALSQRPLPGHGLIGACDLAHLQQLVLPVVQIFTHLGKAPADPSIERGRC
jgi:hypothetical protein